MSFPIDTVPIFFTDSTKRSTIPVWAKKYNAKEVAYAKVMDGQRPGVVIVHAKNSGELKRHAPQTRRLASKLSQGTSPFQVVFFFDKETKGQEAKEMASVFKLFPRLASRLNFSWSSQNLKDRVLEALVKYAAEEEERQKEFPDALAQAKEVIAATRHLRSSSGRLSATAIASALGLKDAQMAALLGRSRQALAKTPDAPAIQQALIPFERIVRLCAVLKKPNFLAWLQRKNPHLDDLSPLEVITSGRPEVVADLVEAMLTGTPS